MIENTHRASSSSQRLQQTRRAPLEQCSWSSPGWDTESGNLGTIRGARRDIIYEVSFASLDVTPGTFLVIFLFGGFLALSVKWLFGGNAPYFIVQVGFSVEMCLMGA